PTVMVAVPRFFEKLYERVMEQVRKASPLRQKLFWWAVRMGGAKGRMTSRMRPIADRLVFNKLRERLGGRLRLVISGSAPVSPVITEFFEACGLPIYEGYGLTETSPVLAVNLPGSSRIGTVGKALPVEEINIAHDYESL